MIKVPKLAKVHNPFIGKTSSKSNHIASYYNIKYATFYINRRSWETQTDSKTVSIAENIAYGIVHINNNNSSAALSSQAHQAQQLPGSLGDGTSGEGLGHIYETINVENNLATQLHAAADLSTTKESTVTRHH